MDRPRLNYMAQMLIAQDKYLVAHRTMFDKFAANLIEIKDIVLLH
jgi:hypothetical protein